MAMQNVDAIQGMDKSKQKRGNDQAPSKSYPTETIGSAQHLVKTRLDVSSKEKFFGEPRHDNEPNYTKKNMNKRTML